MDAVFWCGSQHGRLLRVRRRVLANSACERDRSEVEIIIWESTVEVFRDISVQAVRIRIDSVEQTISSSTDKIYALHTERDKKVDIIGILEDSLASLEE